MSVSSLRFLVWKPGAAQCTELLTHGYLLIMIFHNEFSVSSLVGNLFVIYTFIDVWVCGV